MTNEIYCLLTDCSGARATVVSVHGSENAANAARKRAKYGEVARVPAELGQPVKGERVWYTRRSAEVAGRA